MGPLVFACVVVPEDRLDDLAGLDLRDSKALTPRGRERRAAALKVLLKEVGGSFEILFFSPAEIDEAVRDRTRKLSGLTEEAVARLISLCAPDVAYVDLPGPSAEPFANRIARLLAADDTPVPQIVAEHKADATHPIVSAASILAKVARDAAVREIEAAHGDLAPVGSGYPSDPVTRDFLRRARHLGNAVFRTSWKTWKTG